MSSETEFWNQFAGSSSANVLVIVLVGIFMGLRKVCNRDSRCKSHIHCCCIDLDVRDKTSRELPEILDEGQETTV